MKISASLPAEDVAFLDSYAKKEGIESRSAVLHRAVRLLKSTGLGQDYEEAWSEWLDGGEAEVWETTTDDGLRN